MGRHRSSSCRAADQPLRTVVKDNRLKFYSINYSEFVVITSTKVFLNLDLYAVLLTYREKLESLL